MFEGDRYCFFRKWEETVYVFEEAPDGRYKLVDTEKVTKGKKKQLRESGKWGKPDEE